MVADRGVLALLLCFIFFLNMFLKSYITAEKTTGPIVGAFKTLAQLSEAGVIVALTVKISQTNLAQAAMEQPELRGLYRRSQLCMANRTACLQRLKV